MGNQRKPKPQDRHQRAQEILGTLNRWGVRNLRTLTALPQVALSERLGQEGLRLQQLARGTSERALVVSQPALAFEEVVEPEYPIALLEPLLFVLHHLLEQLCTRLSARALATNELRLRLELDASCSEETASSPLRHGGTEEIDDLKIDDCQLKNPEPTTNGQPLTSLPRTSTLQINADQHGLNRQSRIVNPHSSVPPCLGGKKIYARALHLPLPMLNPKTFLKLLQLELQAHPPGAPVTRIWLAAEPVCPRAAQSRLFLPVSPEPEKLELTLARIAGVVGDGRSGSPEILDTHHPQGFRMRRFAPAAPRQDVVLPDKPSPVTALRIFRPPLRASVVMHAGAPVRVTSAIQPEVRGEIVWSAGPWRASGDWWKEEAWAREEWDVILQNETGAVLYRMYREAGSGQWYVEGSYD